ncbi:hypothetical protein ILYODFUR_015409, partial [Ilyodon furcidens]
RREQVTKTVSEWKTKVADHGLRGQRWSKVKEILIPLLNEPRAAKHKPNSSLNALELANLDSLPQRSASILNERKPSKAQLCRAAEVVGWRQLSIKCVSHNPSGAHCARGCWRRQALRGGGEPQMEGALSIIVTNY